MFLDLIIWYKVLGTDYADGTVFVLFCCTKIQAPELLVHSILRRGVDFAFYFDAFSEIDEEAYFNSGGFQVIHELGFMCRVKFFDGLEFEDHFVFDYDVGHVISDKLRLIIDLDLFSFFGTEAGL